MFHFLILNFNSFRIRIPAWLRRRPGRARQRSGLRGGLPGGLPRLHALQALVLPPALRPGGSPRRPRLGRRVRRRHRTLRMGGEPAHQAAGVRLLPHQEGE